MSLLDDFSSAKRSWKPKSKCASMPTTRNTTFSFKKAQQDVDPALPSLFAASIRASPTKKTAQPQPTSTVNPAADVPCNNKSEELSTPNKPYSARLEETKKTPSPTKPSSSKRMNTFIKAPPLVTEKEESVPSLFQSAVSPNKPKNPASFQVRSPTKAPTTATPSTTTSSPPKKPKSLKVVTKKESPVASPTPSTPTKPRSFKTITTKKEFTSFSSPKSPATPKSPTNSKTGMKHKSKSTTSVPPSLLTSSPTKKQQVSPHRYVGSPTPKSPGALKKKLTSVYYNHKSPIRTAKLLIEGDEEDKDDVYDSPTKRSNAKEDVVETPNTPLSPEEQAEVIKTLNILQLYRAVQKEEPKVEKIDLSKTQDVLDKLKAASEWDAESVSSEAEKLGESNWRTTLNDESKHEYEKKLNHFFSNHSTAVMEADSDDDSVSVSSASSSDVSSVF